MQQFGLIDLNDEKCRFQCFAAGDTITADREIKSGVYADHLLCVRFDCHRGAHLSDAMEI